ncbi:ACT domain-containing protein [Tannockella kyphosi]|uniref:ACT domain-containing protein n=1 Tax=Tannockella kyphosi TaxID=2899121 RepID=UPI0020123004|nr:ACT domain-containing protein [Tannockella kyphosi]
MEKGIITVVGADQVGIIAGVCTFLAKHEVNILDISQTIIEGYFNMMMVVDINNIKDDFGSVSKEMEEYGDELGVIIKLQHENIFHQMHRV